MALRSQHAMQNNNAKVIIITRMSTEWRHNESMKYRTRLLWQIISSDGRHTERKRERKRETERMRERRRENSQRKSPISIRSAQVNNWVIFHWIYAKTYEEQIFRLYSSAVDHMVTFYSFGIHTTYIYALFSPFFVIPPVYRETKWIIIRICCFNIFCCCINIATGYRCIKLYYQNLFAFCFDFFVGPVQKNEARL